MVYGLPFYVIFTGKKTSTTACNTMAAPGPLVPLDQDEAADGARDSAGDKPPEPGNPWNLIGSLALPFYHY